MIESKKQTFVNFSKADEVYTEQHFSNKFLPLDVFSSEKIFTTVINKAAKHFIPAGRIQKIRPNFPSAAAILADERDELRRQDPSNQRIGALNKKISDLVAEHKRNKWHDHIEKSSFNSGQNNLWKVIKGLNNPQKRSDNTMISFNNIPIEKGKKCARLFNTQFTEKPAPGNRGNRKTVPKLKKLSSEPTEPTHFTNEDVLRKLKRMKSSKAIGPDGISTIMLKHLGPLG